MTEDEAKQAFAHCAVFGFKKDTHFMKRAFPSDDDPVEIIVYTIAPLTSNDAEVFAEAGHLVVVQVHAGEPDNRAFTDIGDFKIYLAGLMELYGTTGRTEDERERANGTE